MSHESADKELQRLSSYDMFIAVLTVLSIVNIGLYSVFDSLAILYVIGTVDMFLSLIFFIDFLRRFISAPSKSKYFVRQLGWADLLASLPFPQLKLLRVFRLIKTYNITKQIGIKKAFRNFFRDRASSALYLILFTIILLLQFGSIAILYIEEGNPEANIKTASDAIWWVYVTITTVGYGDQFPVTNQGRALGMLVMFVGVGMFGVMTGFLANKFLPPSEAESNQETDIKQLKADIAEIKSLLKK